MRNLPGSSAVFFWLCCWPSSSSAYSVLTHEQLIDLTWGELLQPLLLKRFPRTDARELQQAHSYAYGGCAIQDLGYYPFGNEFFSDLTHYVRTGEFIANLLRDARDVNEFAFALGAMSHYVGDNIGHHDAVNPATAISFPKLEKKYGPSVTYDEDPHAHVRTEFAFDVDQLSRQRLAPGAYLRFIGLRVSSRLLAQAFAETYSLPLEDLIGKRRPAFRSYRSSVRGFLPRIAYAETVRHRNGFPPEVADDAMRVYLEHIVKADFQTVWKSYRKRAGVETHLIALLIAVAPKIGILSELAIKIPTEDAQDLYIKSVNRSIDTYGGMLRSLSVKPEGALSIPDRDLDTGEKTRPGTYALTDETYAKLLLRLTADTARPVNDGLKRDILDFYSDPNAPVSTKKRPKEWAEVQKSLAALQNMRGASVATTN